MTGKMTKKHYEAFAQIMKVAYQDATGCPEAMNIMCALIEDLSSYLEVGNPRFDKDKFQTACGL